MSIAKDGGGKAKRGGRRAGNKDETEQAKEEKRI